MYVSCILLVGYKFTVWKHVEFNVSIPKIRIITKKLTTKNLCNIAKYNLFLAIQPFKIVYTAWCKDILN